MRVLLTTQPGEGHLNPLVPLARAIIAAGHEVAVACAPSFRPRVADYGLRALPMGLDWSIDSIGEHWPVHTFTLEQIWQTIFAGDSAERALPDLLAIARDWSPDIIVREMTEFGGWLAAEKLVSRQR